MEFVSLAELLDTVSLGTKLHIGVLFFKEHGNKKLILSDKRGIHVSPLCQKFKSTARGYRLCYSCRNMAVSKARNKKESFGGTCINGIYEYTRVIVDKGQTIGLIYIGNILPKDNARITTRIEKMGYSADFLDTLEKNISEEDCISLANLIESYIRMLIVFCPQETRRISSLVDNIKNYILSNLQYPFNLRRVAEVFHYNPKYLGRLFKKETGISISEYINKNRIEQAKTYLSRGKESITEIAYESGFNNITYFNRLFKHYVGVSPNEYRNNYIK